MTTANQPVPLRGHAGKPDLAGDHLNAYRFLEAHGDEVRRSPELGCWFKWNGSWWAEDRLERVPAMAARVIDDLRSWVAEAGDPDDFKRRSSHYTSSAKAGRRDALLDIAGTDPRIVVSIDELDASPMLLACRGTTVDLATGEARKPDPADLLTRGVDVEFIPDAFSDLWVKVLDEVFAGDQDVVSYVQRLLGYCCTGVVAEHVAPVLSGTGANGKTTITGVVQDLLGDYAITSPEGLVIQHHREVHPERLAVLRGRRLVISAELEQHAVLAESLVKLLTGGDTISAREMYGRRFNFKPSHKVLIVSNYKPRVRGVDHAIWRRLRVVPFTVAIPPERQDPTLRRRLVEEHGPAILAWLVQGAVRWHQEGLGTAHAVDEATAAYRTSQDTIGTWLAEATFDSPGTETKIGSLYDEWRHWCERANERPGRRQDFRAAIEEHGITVVAYRNNALARDIAIGVRTGEHSPRNFSISDSRGLLGVSPHESSHGADGEGF